MTALTTLDHGVIRCTQSERRSGSLQVASATPHRPHDEPQLPWIRFHVVLPRRRGGPVGTS
jgi:hypothetical protein